MYRGIVDPHLRHYCSVWERCGEKRLKALQKLQNQAAIVSNGSHNKSTALLIKNFKQLRRHIKQKLILYLATFPICSQKILTEKFTFTCELQQTTIISPRRMTTSKGQKAISFHGAKTWNQLSSDIKEVKLHNSFKCKLKHYLQPIVSM